MEALNEKAINFDLKWSMDLSAQKADEAANMLQDMLQSLGGSAYSLLANKYANSVGVVDDEQIAHYLNDKLTEAIDTMMAVQGMLDCALTFAKNALSKVGA